MFKSRRTNFIIFIVFIIAIFLLFKLLGVYFGWMGISLFVLYQIFIKLHLILKLIAAFQYNKGHEEKALKNYKSAYNWINADSNTKIMYGYMLLKTNKIDEAEDILDKLSLNPKLVFNEKCNVISNLALVKWKKGNLDIAIEMLEGLFQKDYKNSTLYGSLGFLLTEKENLDYALKFNLEAYDYNNSDNVIRDNLGSTYIKLGDYEKAEEIYKQMFSEKILPHFPEAYYNYSKVRAYYGQYEEALELSNQSLKKRFSATSTSTKEEIETFKKTLEQNIQ